MLRRDPSEPSRDWNARAWHVAIALFLMTAAFILTKTGRDAMYFQLGGLFDLPMAYIGIALLALPTALATLLLMQTLGPRGARVAAPVLMALFLGVFRCFAEPGGGAVMTTFFVLVPLVFGVLFSLAWLLAGELLEGASRAQLRRSYALIGAASIAGGTAGAILALVVAPLLDPRELLLAGSVGLVLSAATTAVAQRRWAPRPLLAEAAARPPGPDDFRHVLAQRYSLMLLIVAMLTGLVGILVEFQFYVAAAQSGNTGRENAVFFANLYLVLNGLALVTQLWAEPRIQRRLGVRGSLFILPVALVTGAGALLVNASVLTRSMLRITEGGIKSSVHRSNWEQAYLPLDPAQRAAAKLLVDGAGARMAEGAAAVLLFLWIRAVMVDPELLAQDSRWLTWALIGTASIWVGLTVVLRRSLKPAEERLRSEGRLDVPIPDS